MKINDIMANIVGPYGLASSNKYQISIQPASNTLSVKLTDYGVGGLYQGVSDPIVYEKGFAGPDSKLSYLCDECNIPGYSFATGEFKGATPGINIRYAHTKVYNELSLTFLMDMNHIPYKVMQNWSDAIYQRRDTTGSSNERSFYEVEYYDYYVADIIIEKIEPNNPMPNEYRNALSSYQTHKGVSKVKLVNAFPYTMSNISMSNGPNQPLKFQTSFYYEYLVPLQPTEPTPKPKILPS